MEPALTSEDRLKWREYHETAMAYSRTIRHRRRLEESRRLVTEFLERVGDERWYIGWSAGKDSTALVALVSSMAPGCEVMSVKDDLDFPGEEEYLERVSEQLGVKLTVCRPPISLKNLVASRGIDITGQVHASTSELSRVGFYDVIEEFRRSGDYRGKLLGLRAEESPARAGHLWRKGERSGVMYVSSDGVLTCNPLRAWSGLDVFAYLGARGIEPLHVYRCCRMYDSPADVRKSWWVGGSTSYRGTIAWLRCYYPSLYLELQEISQHVDVRKIS